MDVKKMSLKFLFKSQWYSSKRTKMIDIIEHTETKVEKGRTCSKNDGQQMD